MQRLQGMRKEPLMHLEGFWSQAAARWRQRRHNWRQLLAIVVCERVEPACYDMR